MTRNLTLPVSVSLFQILDHNTSKDPDQPASDQKTTIEEEASKSEQDDRFSEHSQKRGGDDGLDRRANKKPLLEFEMVRHI